MRANKPRVKLDRPIQIVKCEACGFLAGDHKVECPWSTTDSLRRIIYQVVKDARHSMTKWQECAESVTLWQGKFMLMKHENTKLKAKIRAMQKAEK